MNKCIRMGINAFKFPFLGAGGGKFTVLQSEISFYGDKFPQMTDNYIQIRHLER